MTPRLFVRKAARVDVAKAFGWYEAHRAGLGNDFAMELSAAYEGIESQPLRFPLIVDDIRIALLRRFPYVVYFVVLPRHISVIAVVHGHRKPQVWQQRR